MLIRIFSFIMSIIMAIFPFFGEKNTVSNDEVAEAVIYAVENKDASAMEAVMCKNIKDNFDDLTGEINKMLSYIEGDIESISWKSFGGHYINDGNGKSIKQNSQNYTIITSKGAFSLSLTIETDNSFAPDELGIRTIALHKLTKNPDTNSSYEYISDGVLYKIFATEGIGELHN